MDPVPSALHRVTAPRHVLIVNQHGENRGDEAALRAMLDAFAREAAPIRFTVVIQTRLRTFSIETEHDVEFLPALLPLPELPGLVWWSVCRALRLGGVPRSRVTRALAAAYANADLVVSAPGGPYFGDGYWSHEPLHWWFAWLGLVHRTPVFLYAPSAGPFRRPVWNVARRALLRRFAQPLCVREAQSAALLRELVGGDSPVEITADSALQDACPRIEREDYFIGERSGLRARFVVAVSARDQRSMGYDAAFRAAMVRIHEVRDAHFILLPQLTGAHSDVAYLRGIGAGLPTSLSWELADPALDSTGQREIVAISDFCLTGRYHPQIFAAAAGVPGVCVYYEHKALGFMRALELEDLAVDARKVDAPTLVGAVERALARLPELADHLASREPDLRASARRTTWLAVAAMGSARRGC